jgi:hypothetical protein
MVNERKVKPKKAKKVLQKSKPKVKGAKIPKLVLAHELLRAKILCDGELKLNHIKEVANTLDRPSKKRFLNLYLPVVDKLSRVIIRKIDNDNIGVFGNRKIYIIGDNGTILSELPGKNSGKLKNHINSSLPKYKSVMQKKISYKRKSQTITSTNNFYLVGPLAFANHSCKAHMNVINVNGKLENLLLVKVIEKDQQITYDYGYKNNFCFDCNNNK